MGWKKFFSKDALEKGLEYGNDNYVRDVRMSDGYVNALVRGEGKYMYVADVNLEDLSGTGMYCSCDEKKPCR